MIFHTPNHPPNGPSGPVSPPQSLTPGRFGQGGGGSMIFFPDHLIVKVPPTPFITLYTTGPLGVIKLALPFYVGSALVDDLTVT